MKKEFIKKSKYLSLVLRHKPEAADITLDSNGWVEVDDLLNGAKINGVNISRDELMEIIETNEKKRFVLDASGQRIRANQGHSVKVDLELQERKPPAVLYHGTTERFSASILNDGLKRMKRHHVHLSSDTDTAHKVGMRRGKVRIFTVDTEQMCRDGYTFYCSENGVWLVNDVPPRYLSLNPCT